MFRYLVCALGLVFVGLFVLGCSLAPTPPPAAPPIVTIDSPGFGSIFLVGEDVIVQSTLSDETGISRVTLSVDGAIVKQATPDNQTGTWQLEQTWTAAKAGSRTLVVKATNAAGLSDSATIKITVQQSNDPSTSPQVATIPPFVFGTPTTPDAAAVATQLPANTPEAATLEPAAAGCIDDARFVADLTVPDGTKFPRNTPFDKTWELENNGTCVWENYNIVFIGGEQMVSDNSFAVPLTQPGALADIVISMTSPAAYGIHKGTWQMQNPEGGLFGTPITVVINVPSPVVPTVPTGTSVPNRTTTPPLTVLLPTNTPPPTPCKGNPSELTFTASPSSIAAGAEVVLSWGAVTNATYVTLDGGIYAEEGMPAPGTVTVTPGETTEYILRAVCENGGAIRMKKLTVIVNGVQPKTATPTDAPPGSCTGTPEISSFSVNKDTVAAGKSVTLSWGAVTNADEVKLISGGDSDTVSAPGQAKRSPTETTTYRLQASCSAAGTSASETLTVTVTP
jgi:hypothetical protein